MCFAVGLSKGTTKHYKSKCYYKAIYANFLNTCNIFPVTEKLLCTYSYGVFFWKTKVSKQIALPFLNTDAEKDSFLGFYLFQIDAIYRLLSKAICTA